MSRSNHSRKGSFTSHRSGMGHRNGNGKFSLGPGGINCSCCTKGDAEFHKENQRKWERHTSNQNFHNDLHDDEA